MDPNVLVIGYENLVMILGFGGRANRNTLCVVTWAGPDPFRQQKQKIRFQVIDGAYGTFSCEKAAQVLSTDVLPGPSHGIVDCCALRMQLR